ncbi:MAG: hypothetical protein KGL35_29740 [Bradyrhizobium sp.]|nr:hypothetical protein [Bradyrhizobium sp.]
MTVCKNPACGVEFPARTQGIPKVWCSTRCRSSHRARLRAEERREQGLINFDGHQQISDEIVAAVKVLFPSCAGDITAEMVGEPAAWERFTTILPRKLVRMQRAG